MPADCSATSPGTQPAERCTHGQRTHLLLGSHSPHMLRRGPLQATCSQRLVLLIHRCLDNRQAEEKSWPQVRLLGSGSTAETGRHTAAPGAPVTSLPATRGGSGRPRRSGAARGTDDVGHCVKIRQWLAMSQSAAQSGADGRRSGTPALAALAIHAAASCLARRSRLLKPN